MAYARPPSIPMAAIPISTVSINAMRTIAWPDCCRDINTPFEKPLPP